MKNNLVWDILFYLYCPEISVYPFSWLSSPSGFGRIHIILLSGSGGSQLLSHVQLFATPWTLGHQAPLSIGFSRWKYWSGLPFPSWPKIKPASLVSPAMAGGFLTTAPPAKSPFSLTGGLIFLHGAHSVLQLFICPSQFSEGTLFCSPLHPQHLEQFWHTVGTQVLSNACTAGRNRELTNIFRN